MAACLGNELAEAVQKSRVFVVGTGGIGCELIKNLVLTGFQDIVMVRDTCSFVANFGHAPMLCWSHILLTLSPQIDLDTIEVSNLNRQFLFRKCHIGRAKVEVARESVLQFNPQASITALHDSIFK